MATDNSLNLKATLDTSEVQQKLQQLGRTSNDVTNLMDRAVKNLDKSVKDLGQSFEKAALQQEKLARVLIGVATGAGAHMVGEVLNSAGSLAKATGHTTTLTFLDIGAAGAKGAGAGAAAGVAVGSVVPFVGTAAGAAVGAGVGATAGMVKETFKKLTENVEDSAEALKKLKETAAKVAEKQQQDYEKAINTLQKAAGEIKHERELQGLDLLSDDELRNRRQAAYDTRKHYEGNLLAGVYTTEGAVEEAKNLITQAKNITNAINRILKSRKAEAEAAEKSKEAAEEKALAEENAINEEAFSRLQSLLFETAMEQWDEQVKKMPMGDLVKTKDDLKALQQQLRFKLRGELLAGDLSAADLTEAELKETEAKLSSLDTVINGANDFSWLNSVKALGSEAQKGYDVGGYGNLDLQMLKAEQETKDAAKETVSTLRKMDTTMTEMKNVLTLNGGIAATW